VSLGLIGDMTKVLRSLNWRDAVSALTEEVVEAVISDFIEALLLLRFAIELFAR
jgi:hypothetical protein